MPEKRVSKKELGGGTILDWGVYCIQLILKVYNGERPTKVFGVKSTECQYNLSPKSVHKTTALVAALGSKLYVTAKTV